MLLKNKNSRKDKVITNNRKQYTIELSFFRTRTITSKSSEAVWNNTIKIYVEKLKSLKNKDKRRREQIESRKLYICMYYTFMFLVKWLTDLRTNRSYTACSLSANFQLSILNFSQEMNVFPIMFLTNGHFKL